MAQITRWKLFCRAFFLTLVFGSTASAQAANGPEAEAWNNAVNANTAEGYYQYLSLYPDGRFVDEAVRALAVLGAITTRGLSVGKAAPSGAGTGFSASGGQGSDQRNNPLPDDRRPGAYQ